MRNTIFIFIVLIFTACQNKPNKTNNSEKTIPLTDIKGTQILKDYFEIEQLYVVDSLLLAKNNVDSNKKAFSVFDKAGKLLVRFGRIGQGPNDFGDRVTYFNQMFYNEKGNICIWLYERNYQRMRMINLSKTIKNKEVIIEKEIDVPLAINLVSVYHIKPNLVAGNVSNLDLHLNKIRFYNPKTKEIVKRVPIVPKITTEQTKMSDIQYDYNNLFSQFLSFQPKQGFVCTMRYMDRIDFYNLKGEHTNTIFGENYNKELSRINQFPKHKERILYNYTVTATKHHIFVVYNGKSNIKNLDRTNHIIRVYDWNGEEKLKLKPQRPLLVIAVDETEGIIYGVTEDYDVYKYKVKLP